MVESTDGANSSDGKAVLSLVFLFPAQHLINEKERFFETGPEFVNF